MVGEGEIWALGILPGSIPQGKVLSITCFVLLIFCSDIIDFAITPKLPESDHLPVTLDIRVKCQDECPTSTMHYHQSDQWTACTKYVWTKSQLPLINSALNDNISEPFHSEFINAIIDLRGVENVAVAFNDYVNQACERVCNLRKAKPHKKRRGPAWFDPECRSKRSEALRLCDLASRDIEQITSAVQSCKAIKPRNNAKSANICAAASSN